MCRLEGGGVGGGGWREEKGDMAMRGGDTWRRRKEKVNPFKATPPIPEASA